MDTISILSHDRGPVEENPHITTYLLSSNWKASETSLCYTNFVSFSGDS